MNITVILCTYNRCQSLVKALSSVALSRLPESVTWEVLVVDNNSHDRTRDVVATSVADTLAAFVICSNHGQGNRTLLTVGLRKPKAT